MAAGGGKSWALLFDVLKYIDDPNYYGVFFRRTTQQLERSLWPAAKDLYMPFLTDSNGKFIGKARIREKDHKIVFPSGALLEFSYLENDKDARLNWQGAELTGVYLDEFTHFSAFQINYLRTRLRSKSKYPSYMRASMNPDPLHFIVEWIEPWLLESGIPDRSLSGKIRYFILASGVLHTSWEREELVKKFPDKNPRTYTFVPSNIDDNPKMLDVNPDYKDELDSNSPAEREALLNGNWYAMPKGSNYFERSWLVNVDKVPIGAKCVRAWDKASQEPSEQNRYPDYTAGSPLLYKCKDGFFYIKWAFEQDMKDPDTEVVGRFRKRPGERDQLILKQAIADGSDCVVIFAVDPGQSGKVEYQESSKKLLSEGYTVRPDPMPNNKSKLKRFEPLSSAAQNGLIRVVESSFPNKATLEAFYGELESFNGERSTSARKDD